MASVIDICNAALVHIGETPNISSIDPPENSAFAQKCARFYPMARDETLETYNWSFARKRTALALLATNDSAYAYAYQMPADCLKPRTLLPVDYGVEDEKGKGEDFLVEGDVLYSDAPSATLLYTFRQLAPTKFSPLFIEAVACKLGYYLAGAISKDEGTQRRMLQLWRLTVGQAAESNANVGKTTYNQKPSFITARQ